MYKYRVGEKVKGKINIRVEDNKTHKHHFTTKVIEGVIINSTHQLTCDGFENWYTVIDKFDNVYQLFEGAII